MPVTSLALSVLLIGAAPSVSATLDKAIEAFEFGELEAAATALGALLDPIQLDNVEDVILARQYLGACHFLAGRRPEAEAEFAKILALDAEHRLDPGVFSPALVEFFESVRRRTGLSLRPRPPVEPPPPLAPAPPPPEPPPLALAFIPLGVGQFANDHPVRGALFLAAELGLLTTSIVTRLVFDGMCVGETSDGGCIVPAGDENRAADLQLVHLATLYGALGVVAVGIVEALLGRPDGPPAERTASLGPTGLTVRF